MRTSERGKHDYEHSMNIREKNSLALSSKSARQIQAQMISRKTISCKTKQTKSLSAVIKSTLCRYSVYDVLEVASKCN